MKTLLFVDDDPEALDFMGRFFREHGFRTLTADSGEKALELLATEQPDLILLDIQMPGLGGMETLKRIHEKNAAAGVLMVTGEEQRELMERAGHLGALDYILKPFEPQQLLRQVKALLKIREDS